jgi:hypothetical protein
MNAPLLDPALRSQEDNVLDYLRTGREIDPMSALRMFGIMRLGARIFDLRARGHVITSRTVRVGKKAWAAYRMVEE